MTASTDKLTAVNDIISAFGGTQLTALSSGTPTGDEKTALTLLTKHTKVILLEKDWRVNYEEAVVFTADGSGIITMHTVGDPSSMSILRVVMNEINPPAPIGMKDCEMRRASASESSDWRLYDIKNKTFNWGAGVVIYLDVTYKRDFLELPPEFQYAITCRSKVEAMINNEGETPRAKRAMGEAADAEQILLENHLYKGGLRPFRRMRQRMNVTDNPVLSGFMTGRFPWLRRSGGF